MLPLSSISGYALAKRALLALLVDPHLKGIIISGRSGSGKSVLAGSFARFARRYIDPECRVVPIPAGVDIGRLVGEVDLERTLGTGKPVYQRGLLALAHRGTVVANDLNLFDRTALFEIGIALDRGEVSCEREGMSRVEPSLFTLVGTANDVEGTLPTGFVDRVAFQVGEYQQHSVDRGLRMIQRVESWRNDPEAFETAWREKEERMAEVVLGGRMILSTVRVGDLQLQTLADAAAMLGVTGSRGDIFAARGARAHAALRGSRVIEDVDVNFAIATILAPRSNNVPPNEPSMSEFEGVSSTSPDRESEPDVKASSPPDPESGQVTDDVQEAQSSSPLGERGNTRSEGDDERHFDPLDFDGELPDIEHIIATRIGRTEGRSGSRYGWRRGRLTGSALKERRVGSISVTATLRAAAPHQLRRRGEDSRRVVVRRDDLRLKRFSQKTGTLYVFCVDASGSMAANRMREAKGAAARLLQDAYVQRDRVALIVFKGASAQLVLPPTPSIERAKRSLDVLPTGGGTPLASALVTAFGVIEAERRRGHARALVVILTDGRANVPMNESSAGMIMEVRRRHVRSELERVTALFRLGGIGTLVVDTKQSSTGDTDASRLATMLGGRHYHLPHVNADEIARVAREA